MRNIKYFLLLVLFAACNKPVPRNNEITKIEFAKIGTWLDRGAAIRIDSSLEYNYYRGASTAKDGKYYKGKITQAYWDTINKKLEELKYKTLDTTEHFGMVDGSAYEIIITWKNGKRRITRERDNKQDSILMTFDWINNTYKNVKLHPSNDSLKFETTYQLPPPTPKTDQVKFPPPNVKY
ncbi:MAG: hypothetical protein ABI367_02685 [Mucilaginibacter sp.]